MASCARAGSPLEASGIAQKATIAAMAHAVQLTMRSSLIESLLKKKMSASGHDPSRAMVQPGSEASGDMA